MGAREERSHVAHISTELFLSRSRLDRNHSCTHSTHVLARGRDVWLVDFGTFLALACDPRWALRKKTGASGPPLGASLS